MAGLTKHRLQRIRDPLHNLIEFGGGQFERVMWRVIQTRPFQRLRRIKQLGFSDLIYPGATHTRFAHSVGVFHTARQLMRIIQDAMGDGFQEYQARVALAAALVHDLGHGMFSHAFEDVGRKLALKMAHHETVSDLLIRDSDVSEELKKELGSGFANDVADVIKRGRPGNLYDAVVSSQFDADRLDYMQRDRLMTGVQNSGIDFSWLIKNLEIGTIKSGVDDEPLGEIETFVLGPKATYAAETYVLSLFQLYPTVYFHKATRGAEMMFSALMSSVMRLIKDGSCEKTGLPAHHPIVKFGKDSDSLDNALALDDTVFWGALPMMAEATHHGIAGFAERLLERRLLKCIDIRERLISASEPAQHAALPDKEASERLIDQIASIGEKIKAWQAESGSPDGMPRVLVDMTARDPYKRFQESKGPLNQILLRTADGRIRDMAEASPVVAAIRRFDVFRAYIASGDQESRSKIEAIVNETLRSNHDG